jgi:Tfp pilus assembly protein PilX
MRKGLRRFTLLRHRAANEDRGFAVPTVLFMLLAAFAVVSVGVAASIQAQSGSVRDQDTKSAFAAAEAGMNQALFRYNAYTELPPQPCVMPSGTALAVAPTQTSGPNAGWCPTVSDSAGRFHYDVCPSSASSPCNTTSGSLLIVATGTFHGVTRRIEETATSAGGQPVFSDAQVKTQDKIEMGSSATIRANSATNGDISMSSSAQQCGLATVGPGHHMTTTSSAKYFPNTQCTPPPLDPSTVAQQPITLPPVNQGDAPTNNDDYRIVNAKSTANPPPTPADAIGGKKSDVVWTGSDPTAPNSRQLTLNSSVSLTLTGRTYSFCKLTMNSSANLYIATSAPVYIFFDSPEACGLPANTTQLASNSSTRITSNFGSPINLALLFVGSQATPPIPTKISMNSSSRANGGCIDNFVIYAPYTDFTLNSSSNYCGGLVAKSLTMASSSQITTNPLVQTSFQLPNTLSHYVTSKYLECTAASASPPNSGC